MRSLDLNTDHALLCTWWKAYNFPVIAKESLPKHGLIVENTCAGFIYSTDSNIAWIEFIVGNPDITKELRQAGLKTLIPGLTEKAKSLGFKFIFTSTNHSNLEKLLVESDYVIGDTNVTHLLRSI